MQIIERLLPADHNLYLISDIHEGTFLQHEHGLNHLIEVVSKDKNGYVAILGDLAEAITIDDKRYDASTVDSRNPLPLQQYQSLVSLFKPIRGKILVTLEGNHDYKISARFGNGVRDIFCRELEIPYGTYSCKLNIKDKKKRLQYKTFLTHGFGSVNSVADDPVRREANMQLSLKRRLYRKAGDCSLMAMGHTHKLIVKPPISDLYLTDDGEKIKQHYTKPNGSDFISPDLRWYCNTGSFYKLYHMTDSGYAERFGYDPTELGFCVAEVKGGSINNVRKVILG